MPLWTADGGTGLDWAAFSHSAGVGGSSRYGYGEYGRPVGEGAGSGAPRSRVWRARAAAGACLLGILGLGTPTKCWLGTKLAVCVGVEQVYFGFFTAVYEKHRDGFWLETARAAETVAGHWRSMVAADRGSPSHGGTVTAQG